MDYKLLGNIPLFNQLPDHILQQIAGCMTKLEFPTQSVLIREGEPGDDFFVVLSGKIEVIKALGTADERLLASRGVGDFFGELSLVNPDGLRTASVRTLGPTQLWRMAHQDFNDLLHEQSDLALEMIRVLSARLTYAHNMTIQDLHEKNQELQMAYDELKEAHEQILEKEKLERELQLAAEIQQSILPHQLPELSGYDFGALMYPARAVGGDFYDLFPLDANQVGIVIGDVADKGIPSAIFMAQTHAMIYSEATRCASPHEVLDRVNTHLTRMETSNMFVTVLYGVMDCRTHEFTYARAGHELPLICQPTKFVTASPMGIGQPLGIFDKPKFDVQTVSIQSGSVILLYTDGLTDCRNPNGEPFGLNRIKDLIPTLSHLPAQEICAQFREHLKNFQQNAPQDDDVTVVVLQAKN